MIILPFVPFNVIILDRLLIKFVTVKFVDNILEDVAFNRIKLEIVETVIFAFVNITLFIVLFEHITLLLLTSPDNKLSSVTFVAIKSVVINIPAVIDALETFVIIAAPALILLEVILVLIMLDTVAFVTFKDGKVIFVTSIFMKLAVVANTLLEVIDDVIKFVEVILDTLRFDVVRLLTFILLDCKELIVPFVVSKCEESNVPIVAKPLDIFAEDTLVPYKLLTVILDVLRFVKVEFVVLIFVESTSEVKTLLADTFDIKIFVPVKFVFTKLSTCNDAVDILVLITFPRVV